MDAQHIEGLLAKITNPPPPDIHDLLLVHTIAESLRSSTSLDSSIADVADHLGKNKHQLYRAIEKVRHAANATNIFESTPGSGSRLSSTDDELCGKIERILQAYYDLIAPYAEESILVRVALPHVISATILAEMIMSLYDKMEEQNIQTRVEFSVSTGETMTAAETQPQIAGKDIILSTSPDLVQHEEKEACYPIDIGLVCNSRSGLKQAVEAAQRSGISRAFPWHLVRDKTLVYVDDAPKKLRNILFQNFKKKVTVETFEEALNQVARGAGICVGFRDLIDEHFQKYVSFISMKDVSGFEPVELCLARPKKSRERRSDLAKQVISWFVDIIKDRLAKVQSQSHDTERLSKEFEEFRQIWFMMPSARNAAPRWVNSEVELYATTSYIMGTVGASQAYAGFRLFGRLSSHGISNYNLVMRGESPDKSDQFSCQFLFSEFDLQTKRRLVGLALGRGDNSGPGVGAVVLLKEPILDARVLDAWVGEYDTSAAQSDDNLADKRPAKQKGRKK